MHQERQQLSVEAALEATAILASELSNLTYSIHRLNSRPDFWSPGKSGSVVRNVVGTLLQGAFTVTRVLG